MKVRALKSFVGYDQNRKKYHVAEGDEFDLPPGVDWLKKGLAVEVKKGEQAEPKKPGAK